MPLSIVAPGLGCLCRDEVVIVVGLLCTSSSGPCGLNIGLCHCGLNGTGTSGCWKLNVAPLCTMGHVVSSDKITVVIRITVAVKVTNMKTVGTVPAIVVRVMVVVTAARGFDCGYGYSCSCSDSRSYSDSRIYR